MHEIVVAARYDAKGWHASGTLERGFAEAARRFGERYISGVRGEESGARKLRMMTHGTATERTCAPIGWWSAEDVFAYLHANGLPVHPAYAYSLDGLLDRARLRVAALGGERGTGWGRRQWEERYYSDALHKIAVSRPWGLP
jgi:3'-phosphoadenosine 5'-phosphosulfate sulfotransferase (PAPS reductase)/FAD synthetase